LWRDAETAGGVLAVRDREMYAVRRYDFWQVARDHAAAGGGEDVAYKEEICQNRRCLF
jgi:hypothetical protein